MLSTQEVREALAELFEEIMPIYKVVVTGARDFGGAYNPVAETWAKLDEARLVFDKLNALAGKYGRQNLRLAEGGAPGADHVARVWATKHGVPYLTYHAEWAKYGHAAGPVRNQKMLDDFKPDLVLAFHRFLPNSKGTKDCVLKARAAGIPVEVYGGPDLESAPVPKPAEPMVPELWYKNALAERDEWAKKYAAEQRKNAPLRAALEQAESFLRVLATNVTAKAHELYRLRVS